LREELRLRIFENRVLRRIFGPKRYKATGEWRRLLNKELNYTNSSPYIIRVIRMIWTERLARMWEMRGAYSVLMGKLDGRKPLGRPRRGWKNNIKMNLQKVGWDMDWIALTQNRNR
jgi:hypothetical protein